VEPFFRFQVSNHINIIGTKIQVVDGKLTGRFLTKNCYGEEKVRRMLEQYPDRKEYKLVAYGDSRGDHALLDFADEGHYREF
jgi:phosphoserine phosphatase